MTTTPAPLPAGARLTRAVMIASLLAYTLYFDARYGLSFEQPGMDGLWPIVWIVTLLGLVVAHLPAWFLVRTIAAVPARARRSGAVAAAPLGAVAIAGVAIQGADWDELALFLIPTLPTLTAVITLAAIGSHPHHESNRT